MDGFASVFRGYRGNMLVVLTLGAVSAKVGRFLIPALLPTIILDLRISSFEAGIALSLLSVCFAFAQYPSGRFSDHLSRKTILVVSLLFLLLGFILLLGTFSYVAFIFAVVIIGIGDGLYPVAARALLSDLFSDRRGQVMGFLSAALDIGGLVAAMISIGVLALVSWRLAFLVAIIPLFVILISMHLYNKEEYVFARIKLEFLNTNRRLFKDPTMFLLIIAYSLFAFSAGGILGFLPTFLQLEKGFSPSNASLAYAVLFATGMIAKPGAGRLSDRISRPLVAGGGMILGGLGMALMILSTTFLWTIVGILVLAIGYKAFPPSMQAHLMDLFPEPSMGGDLGATSTISIGLGSLGPLYVGYIASTMNYSIAFAGIILLLLACATILFAIVLYQQIASQE